MDISVFTEKKVIPDNESLCEALGKSHKLWNKIKDHVILKYPEALEDWNYPGVKYGWSFRMKDKKRAIIYLLPRDNFFKVAFVFGQKANDIIMESNICKEIKAELQCAKVYAEGRGIRIDIKNDGLINDIYTLIDIKIST